MVGSRTVCRAVDGSINRLERNRNAAGNDDVGRVDDVKRKDRDVRSNLDGRLRLFKIF